MEILSFVKLVQNGPPPPRPSAKLVMKEGIDPYFVSLIFMALTKVQIK